MNLESAIYYFKKCTNKSEIGEANFYLGFIYSNIKLLPDEGYLYYLKALHNTSKEKDKRLYNSILYKLSLYHNRFGDADSTRHYAFKSLEYSSYNNLNKSNAITVLVSDAISRKEYKSAKLLMDKNLNRDLNYYYLKMIYDAVVDKSLVPSVIEKLHTLAKNKRKVKYYDYLYYKAIANNDLKSLDDLNIYISNLKEYNGINRGELSLYEEKEILYRISRSYLLQHEVNGNTSALDSAKLYCKKSMYEVQTNAFLILHNDILRRYLLISDDKSSLLRTIEKNNTILRNRYKPYAIEENFKTSVILAKSYNTEEAYWTSFKAFKKHIINGKSNDIYNNIEREYFNDIISFYTSLVFHDEKNCDNDLKLKFLSIIEFSKIFQIYDGNKLNDTRYLESINNLKKFNSYYKFYNITNISHNDFERFVSNKFNDNTLLCSYYKHGNRIFFILVQQGGEVAITSYKETEMEDDYYLIRESLKQENDNVIDLIEDRLFRNSIDIDNINTIIVSSHDQVRFEPVELLCYRMYDYNKNIINVAHTLSVYKNLDNNNRLIEKGFLRFKCSGNSSIFLKNNNMEYRFEIQDLKYLDKNTVIVENCNDVSVINFLSQSKVENIIIDNINSKPISDKIFSNFLEYRKEGYSSVEAFVNAKMDHKKFDDDFDIGSIRLINHDSDFENDIPKSWVFYLKIYTIFTICIISLILIIKKVRGELVNKYNANDLREKVSQDFKGEDVDFVMQILDGKPFSKIERNGVVKAGSNKTHATRNIYTQVGVESVEELKDRYK
ncbi:hypothetical protein [Flammeovirga sp. SJP92]|uniref:hypothetical protein n=1 Tax=Flammeovirga sp. SJP92 TaxID=1775430 RepID=UPI00156084BE|nr:hypothetical protein [Flammeovirga sp. SJP92]